MNRATKPSVDHFTSTGGHSSNPFGLRDVFVPVELMPKFLNLAQRNTNNNIETCGILGGKLVSVSLIRAPLFTSWLHEAVFNLDTTKLGA